MDINKLQSLRNEGKSYRQIAKELGVSKSTVHNKLKFASQPQLNPTQTVSLRLPPGNGQFAVNPVQTFTGVFRGGKNFYVPADYAIQQSRENARRMWNNLTIREALQSRLWAAAEQAGHVEPQDKKDKRQVQVASDIQQTIESIPDFLKLKYCLLKSRFFGCYGVQLKYQWKGKQLMVKAWSPVHGDSILFKQDSDDIAIYTTIGGGPGVKHVTSEAGYIGRAHVLEDGREVHFDSRGMPYQDVNATERQAFLLMTYDPDPGDFLDSRSAGGVKGLGIRSTLYPTWYAAQEVLGNLMDWVERVGGGLTVYRYMRGNQASYNAAVELAQSQSSQAVVMVPVEADVNGGRPVEGVERIEVPATGLDNMMRIIEDFYNAQMRRFIVGQDSTSQPVTSGLGSKISEVQESAFFRIVKFDCQDLSQCLTHQLVQVLQDWNHPDTQDFVCRYVVDCDSSDVDRQMAAIKTAWEMGVEFDEDEVRSKTGMSKPDLDAKVIRSGTAAGKPTTPQEATEGQEPTEGQPTDLRTTVGGLQAIAALQSQYYGGKIARDACIANVVLLFGFSRSEAESLFPETPPEKLTQDTQPSDEEESGEPETGVTQQ